MFFIRYLLKDKEPTFCATIFRIKYDALYDKNESSREIRLLLHQTVLYFTLLFLLLLMNLTKKSFRFLFC